MQLSHHQSLPPLLETLHLVRVISVLCLSVSLSSSCHLIPRIGIVLCIDDKRLRFFNFNSWSDPVPIRRNTDDTLLFEIDLRSRNRTMCVVYNNILLKWYGSRLADKIQFALSLKQRKSRIEFISYSPVLHPIQVDHSRMTEFEFPL